MKKIKKIWKKFLKAMDKLINLVSKKFKTLSKIARLITFGTLILITILFIIGSVWKEKIFKEQPKQIYEVAIMVRNQNNTDSAEDLRTSLKAGDVIVVQKENHSWSNTERISYLILKMNLTEDEASKLTKPEERGLTKAEIKDEKGERGEANKDIGKEDKKGMEDEINNRKITTRAREYRINMEKYFEDFDPMILLDKGQPYLDKTFDWGIVEHK